MATSQRREAFQLKITLEGIKPPIWRRILVPGSVHLPMLHEVFQTTMGWTNTHLHCFTIDDETYGTADSDDEIDEEEIDETDVVFLEAIGDHKTFSYEYDFGDGWTHRVEVEARTRPSDVLKHAICLEGANACPPEDCGGPLGYKDLLQVLAAPSHEDHDRLLEWVGGSFDATAFDLIGTNAALQQIR